MTKFFKNRINILGVNIDNITLEELIQKVDERLELGKKLKIMYVNIHVMNIAFIDNSFKEILNRQDIIYCDGFGVKVGAFLLGEKIKERMTGADWIYNVINYCNDKNRSIFILGGKEGVAERASNILKRDYPNLKIVGIQNGYFSKEENLSIIEKINKTDAQILFVGMGSPIQERWVDENHNYLNTKIIWCVGALFDFVAGEQKRGPKYLTDYGFEWLTRFYYDPKRLWKRYLIGNPLFFYRIFKEKLTNFNRDRI